jgi:SIR2-like domain/SEC-C motif
MLDGSDKATFYSLRLLCDAVAARRKPILIWAGAGVSMWAGYPNWQETALRLHTYFRKFELNYDKDQGKLYIDDGRLPDVFELLRQTNPRSYNRELANLFTSRSVTPVYRRFLSMIEQIAPTQILTTNIDEMLEHNLPNANAVQRSDIEKCASLLSAETSFVAKLHGSVSAIQSTVFTTSDYQELLESSEYARVVETLLQQATIVFLGYSLRDRYILDLLQRNCEGRPLFGDGPHFLVQSSASPALPESIKVIHYLPEPYGDHRSAITVLDIVRVTRETRKNWFAPIKTHEHGKPMFGSSYFLTDVVPPGTWTSSQSLILGREGDTAKPNALVGQGFDASELPQSISTAMHDVMVGLLSFDNIYVPLSCVGRLHQLLGPTTFWDLVRSGPFHFIYFEMEPMVLFRAVDAVDGGDIGICKTADPDGTPITAEKQIRRQIRAAPGQEREVEQLFKILEANVSSFDHERFDIPSLTRGTLLHPSVQRLLGISDAVLPNSFPRWAAFPVMRLAHTIMAGCACDNFSLGATKIGFGSEVLVGAAFAASAARDWADSVGSYVMTGQFNSDLGAYVETTPSIWTSVLAFRDTQPGINLRREIHQEIATDAGGEFCASVNAGLRQIIPTAVMENARKELTDLMFRRERDTSIVPAVWTNVRNSDAAIRLWRARSRRELDLHCRVFGLRPNDQCPCRSGEKLRDCCAEALKG